MTVTVTNKPEWNGTVEMGFSELSLDSGFHLVKNTHTTGYRMKTFVQNKLLKLFYIKIMKTCLWWSLCTLYLHACQVRVTKSSGLFQKHERTSMKEHLVWHGSKHKRQVHTTKRNKRQQKRKQTRTHFQNKKQRETRERSLTKTKARVQNENRWVQQTHTLTHSHTLTRTCTSTA